MMRPPADFDEPERALWCRSIAALQRLGVWDAIDRDALERMCRASASERLAHERIAARVLVDPASAYVGAARWGSR